MSDTPDSLRDAASLLTEDGFKLSNLWYHGTSSALVDSILAQGIRRSGDKALQQAFKSTMATIGGEYTETTEPVFLSPCKELAYYWAKQTVRKRNLRFGGEELPAVFAVELPEDLNKKVRPDVGAVSFLMLKEGEDYMEFLARLYQDAGFTAPQLDFRKADRMEYLTRLGLAYLDEDIPVEMISLVNY